MPRTKRTAPKAGTVIATPITFVTDSATSALLTARALVADGFTRITSHVGPLGEDLRDRLARGDQPDIVVIDLVLDVTGPNFLRGLAVSGLDLGDAIVIVISDNEAEARAAGADLVVPSKDADATVEALREACMRHKARTVNRLRREVVRAA